MRDSQFDGRQGVHCHDDRVPSSSSSSSSFSSCLYSVMAARLVEVIVGSENAVHTASVERGGKDRGECMRGEWWEYREGRTYARVCMKGEGKDKASTRGGKERI